MTGSYSSPIQPMQLPTARSLPHCAEARPNSSIPLQLSINPPQSLTSENGDNSSSPSMVLEYPKIPGLIHSPGPRPTSSPLLAGMMCTTKTWTRGRSHTSATCRGPAWAGFVHLCSRRGGSTQPLEPRQDPCKYGMQPRVAACGRGQIQTG